MKINWILASGIFLVVAAAFADDDAVFAPEAGTITMEQQIDMRGLLDDYLKTQNWMEGPNQKAGETIFVATGIGVIQVSSTSADIVSARLAAYDKAMLRAKQAMTEYLGIQIQTEATLAYAEGKLKKLTVLDAGTPSLMDKFLALINATLDDMLANKGAAKVDMSADEIEKLAKTSEEYQRLTRTMAQAISAGLQAYKVIEQQSRGGKGEIGVVAVYSPKLMRMAYALASDTAVARTTPKKPLAEQIPNDTALLISSYGTSQRIDENGDYVLVAFGQAHPVTQSAQSRLMAERKARTQALGYLRSFAGESVSVVTDLLEAESTKEYENNTASYDNESSYRESIRTKADAMNISGVDLLRRWQAVHPESGTDICGVVLVWSPGRSAQAHQFEKGIRNDIDKAVNNPPNTKVPAQGAAKEGIEGDPDGI